MESVKEFDMVGQSANPVDEVEREVEDELENEDEERHLERWSSKVATLRDSIERGLIVGTAILVDVEG